tara:strand:- start:534 stop:2006 length:1473 start_codon:yes stop_codon:yes gene_type:complete
MNCVASVRFYVDKMLSETPGMKVLMVDAETIQMLSLVYSQSQIMEKEVFLVERLGEEHERMTHLNAIVFVRPTAANLALLKKEVNEPKYGKYYMFFSNTLNQGHLAELAEADEHEVVEQVQEYFADFFAVNRNLFHCGVSGMVRVSMLASAADRTLRESASIDRAVDGLVSVLLALKMRPVIRHCAHAPTGTPSLAAEFANAVASRIKTEDEKGDFFQFRAKSGQPPPLLLVLNRRDDPVTPLLSQWTYQAMVHELIGLDNNRVDMTRAPECREDMQQVVLAQQDDDFYAEHMYDNFGDLGASVSGLLATYQQRHQSTRQIDSIQDMQRFVEHYPEFKKMSANVAKHIAIMTYLSHIVAQRTLMPVSECEQEIACVDSLTEQRAAVLEMLANPSVRPIEKLKLSMLFALRYETHRSSREVRDSLTGAEDKDLVNLLLQWAGSAQRSGDVFRNKNKVSVRACVWMMRTSPAAAHWPPSSSSTTTPLPHRRS